MSAPATQEKKGRGRPRMTDEEKEAARLKREAERESSGYYGASFPGRVQYLCGIKTHPASGIPYAHHCHCAGLGFQVEVQKPYYSEEDDGIWGRLSKPGSFGILTKLTAKRVQRFRDEVKDYVFRPRYIGAIETDADGRILNKAASFRLLNLSARKFEEGIGLADARDTGLVYARQAQDIPAADCLVLIRVKDAKKHSRSENELPPASVLDPTLAEVPEAHISSDPFEYDDDPHGEEW